MKIRWRQHEIIFSTIILLIAVSGFWWKMNKLSAAQLNLYALPFINKNSSFNFYTNLVLPQFAIFGIIYIAVLWINLFIVPRLVDYKKMETGSFTLAVTPQKKALATLTVLLLKKYIWVFIQLGLLFLCMGVILNAVGYYREQYNFNYPEFSFFPGNGHHSTNFMNMQEGFENAAAFLLGYGIYILVRELIIFFINRSASRREYRVLILNQVTSFAVLVITIPFIVATYNLSGNSFSANYFAIVTPVLLVYLCTTYLFFPKLKEASFLKFSLLWKLLLLTLICSFPAAILGFGNDSWGPVSFILVCWPIALFIMTPISWLLFQQRRDKILSLKGVEKELVKSTTNLQSLRSQINPHFLYNILNTLYGTAIQENADRTATGIQQLGDMMRFMLDENHLDFIAMETEIEYLQNYIGLQKLRIPADPSIVIEDNIAAQQCNHTIAPMLLIPFVENAFKHGIRLNEKSWIKISLQCAEKSILFEVRNSMHQKMTSDPEKERSGIGLVNVVERLKLIYPGKFQYSVNADGNEFFIKLMIETTK